MIQENLNIYIIVFLFSILVILVVRLLTKRTEGIKTTGSIPGGTIFEHYSFKDGRKTNVANLVGTKDNWVVLLHNNPFNKQIWYPLFAHMQHLYEAGQQIPNLLAYDLKGHGTAWKPVDAKYNDTNSNNVAWTMSQFAGDLDEIYKKFIGRGKITLVGYGFGGAVAQEFALTNPKLIDKLLILQTTLEYNPGVDNEIMYLSPLLQRNLDIYYLTMDEQFVQRSLCMWFLINDLIMCPQNTLDNKNVSESVEYVLVQKLFREGSASTTLQVDKLLKNITYKQKWANTKVDFPIILLTADADPLAPISVMTNEFKVLKSANSESRYVTVKGKHGYTIIHPEVIAGLL